MTAIGNLNLFKEPRAAIINSRQGKTPDSSAQWLRNTLDLVEELLKNNAAIISSIGMTTWELITWKVSNAGGSLILVIPDIDPAIIPKVAENIISDFEIDTDRVLMIFPGLEAKPEDKYKKFPKRDFWIASLADRIYPVSVRPNGNQSRLIELFSIIPRKVSDKFKIEYEKPAGASFHPSQLPPLIQDEGREWDYLTHWTRTAIEPWPGETKAEYYDSIAAAASGYSHDGCHTLSRILRDMRILASDKLIRGGFDVVSLTERPPWELSKVIKWRSSLLRWTFEPYGIAIKREKLESLGARKVIYGQKYQYRFLQSGDRAFFQSVESEGDWREEKEWRLLGNLDLRKFLPEDIQIIVHTFDQAEELSEWSPFPVMYWEEFGVVVDEEEF